MAGKSARITVDLGSVELVKSLKIAAIEHRRTVRDIVVEALEAWLAESRKTTGSDHHVVSPTSAEGTAVDKDYVSMMETLNRYRRTGDR